MSVKIALNKLRAQYSRVCRASNEAHGISSGAGCTPFISEAREEQRRYIRMVDAFAKQHPRLAKEFINGPYYSSR
jgi:hypothetical protein